MPGSILCVCVCVPEGVKPWLTRGVQLAWLRQSGRRLKGCPLVSFKAKLKYWVVLAFALSLLPCLSPLETLPWRGGVAVPSSSLSTSLGGFVCFKMCNYFITFPVPGLKLQVQEDMLTAVFETNFFECQTHCKELMLLCTRLNSLFPFSTFFCACHLLMCLL